MALWLMHTYALGLCGKLPEDLENLTLEDRALILGNIVPDWVNYLEGGRKMFRQKTHYKDGPFGIRFEDFKKELFYPAKDSVERAFFTGYGLHLLLDARWHKNIFQAYLPQFKENRDYYDECLRWDGVVDREGPRGHECRVLLGTSPQLFEGVPVDPEVVPPLALERLKEQAHIFSVEPLTTEEPRLFKKEDVERTLEEFQEDALQFLNDIK